ncbi:MAG TPA: lysylphosphatidylglycerol synthase transmembrane domain-containing protein [Candidatus Limnocylindrales bacterium]|nr:lysylphosphatidylglycerol synthase transmembrane domain-containing protein [Candidatus Limnocylindrales bacterium]
MSSSRRALQAIVGIAVSVVAIIIVLGSVDLARTAEVLGRTAPAWLLLVAAFIAGDVLVRAVRWQRLIAPIRHVAYGSMLAYLLVGYLANNVLPARLGELVRSHYLGDREGMSRTATLGTVVVERVVDTAVVVAIAAVAILVLNVRGVVTNAVLIGVAIVTILVVGLAIGVAAHRLPGAEAVARRAARWPRVGDLVTKLRTGLAVAGRPRTLFETLALSVIAWAATLLAFAAAGQAVGLELRIGEAALLSSGVALASAIPAGPGYLGTYELAAVKIAEALGLPTDEAFATALIVHATILVVTSIGGAVALSRLGWRSPRPRDLEDA